MSHAFIADAMKRSERRNMRWYQNNLMMVLLSEKEKQARDIDQTIAIAAALKKKLEEKVDLPITVPQREVAPSETIDMMKPIEPAVLEILYGSTEKGSAAKYLTTRYKKPPEDSGLRFVWTAARDGVLKTLRYLGREDIVKLPERCPAELDSPIDLFLEVGPTYWTVCPRFYFRAVSSWDYGWQQRQSRLLQKDTHRGRMAILRETFYRKNNLGPDPPHYVQPSGGEVSICSEYACNAH